MLTQLKNAAKMKREDIQLQLASWHHADAFGSKDKGRKKKRVVGMPCHVQAFGELRMSSCRQQWRSTWVLELTVWFRTSIRKLTEAWIYAIACVKVPRCISFGILLLRLPEMTVESCGLILY